MAEVTLMLVDYLTAAMERAHYEMIEDQEPFYGEILGLQGIWANGSSLEGCRRNLMMALEDWVFFSIYRGEEIPSMGAVSLELPCKSA
jgi:predicted RNase H-like HicB family nuclease